VSAAPDLTTRRWAPPLIGFSSFVFILAAVEILIRVGVINRLSCCCLPKLRQVSAASSSTKIFCTASCSRHGNAWPLACCSSWSAGAFLHRVRLFRLACETWIAAIASAPLVLLYPLFLVIFARNAFTIIMMYAILIVLFVLAIGANALVAHCGGPDETK